MGVYSYSYQGTDAAARAGAVVDHLIILSVQAVIIVFLGLIVRHGQTPVKTARAGFISPVRQGDVRGFSTTVMSDDRPLPTLTPTVAPTLEPQQEPAEPTVLPHPASNPTKSSYTIAIIGDSMEDTMGERLEYLEHALSARYPTISFTLYNYGRGSEHAEDVLARFHESFQHVDRNYPKIDDVKPDIIIVGCASYNVFTPHFRDRHWLACTHLVQEAQKITSHVYMLAEIAPLRFEFSRAPGGPNYDPDTAYRHSGHIIEQLQNVIGLSHTLGLPLIDAFTPSLQPDKLEGNPAESEGKREYVNNHDNLHPSVAGHEFMADIIASRIVLR